MGAGGEGEGEVMRATSYLYKALHKLHSPQYYSTLGFCSKEIKGLGREEVSVWECCQLWEKYE